MSVLWSCFLTCYNFASTWKSIVMFLMLISNVVFLIDSMSSMALQQLPHLQKLDGLTLQADASRDYTTNHIYLQHVLCLGSVSDAVFFKNCFRYSPLHLMSSSLYICHRQGSHASWKYLKVLEFQTYGFKAWKVLENKHRSLKVLELNLKSI